VKHKPGYYVRENRYTEYILHGPYDTEQLARDNLPKDVIKGLTEDWVTYWVSQIHETKDTA